MKEVFKKLQGYFLPEQKVPQKFRFSEKRNQPLYIIVNKQKGSCYDHILSNDFSIDPVPEGVAIPDKVLRWIHPSEMKNNTEKNPFYGTREECILKMHQWFINYTLVEIFNYDFQYS